MLAKIVKIEILINAKIRFLNSLIAAFFIALLSKQKNAAHQKTLALEEKLNKKKSNPKSDA